MDRRDFAVHLRGWRSEMEFDEERHRIRFPVDQESLDEEPALEISARKDGYAYVELPARYEVCTTCDGKGSHVNPSIDSNGITASEMDELGPEFLEDYMSGTYDQQCNECLGRRVVPEVARDEVRGDAQKAALRLYDSHEQAVYDCAAEAAYERRMGC